MHCPDSSLSKESGFMNLISKIISYSIPAALPRNHPSIIRRVMLELVSGIVIRPVLVEVCLIVKFLECIMQELDHLLSGARA